MQENRYLTGEFYEYYQEFNGDNVNNKAQEFKSTVDFISNEFENIKNVISNWSGEGAITMSSTIVDNIIERFNLVKKNMDDALIPATKAIENLKVELELMKTKETELKRKEKELATKEANKPPEKVWRRISNSTSGRFECVDNPKYAEWEKEVEALNQEIAALITELNGIKRNCENYIKEIKALEASIIDFSYLLGNAASLMGDNETALSSVTEKLSNYKLLTEEELKFMNDEEKTTLNSLYEQGDSIKLAEYLKYLDKTISKRIYSTPISERGLTSSEQTFINDHIHDKNMIRIFYKGKEIEDSSKIELEEGETVELIVKLPTNNGEHIELCRTGVGRDRATEGMITQNNSLAPDRYKRSAALPDTGYFVWTITGNKKGKNFHISQTAQFNTEKQAYYNSESGNGAFKEMFNVYVDVV